MNYPGTTMTALHAARERLAAHGADLTQARTEVPALFDAIAAELASGDGVRALTYMLILLVTGCGIEWLYWTYAHAPLRALRAAQSASRGRALVLGLRALGLRAGGLAIFVLASIAASAAFVWPPGVHETVVASVLATGLARLAWIVLDGVLAPGPGREAMRLVPLAPAHVRPVFLAGMLVALLASIALFMPDLLEGVAGAPHSAGALRLACACAIALLLGAGAFVLGRTTSDRPVARRRLPVLPGRILFALAVAGVFLLWLFGALAVAKLAGIATGFIALQYGLRPWVFHFWPQAGEGADAGAAPEIALSIARFVLALALAGLGACALLVEAPLGELSAGQSFALRLGLSLLGVAVLALFARVAWIVIRTGIDHRLAAIGEVDPHAGPHPSSRLLTLLPLLRTTSAVLLAIMLILSSLWALGIEITPLLAGAGVAGLALGFGAQALVRDIIAGVFYLAEDVFRVGEYIESGTTTKGTVERITLRTVALRHHNGPLHFVPYGSLGTVRNNSRDWVIEKFNIPLPVDVDSEQIRKMIKKIGAAMMEDPEVGPLMREPLKSKLYLIEPGVKIFRCKFETAPGNQFDVRAQAFKRIEAGLRALGLGFADGRQTLIVERPADPVRGTDTGGEPAAA